MNQKQLEQKLTSLCHKDLRSCQNAELYHALLKLTQELALMNEKLEREEKRKESSDETESGLKE